MQSLAEPDTIFNTNYIYEYLKTQTLSFVTNSNKFVKHVHRIYGSAVRVVDDQYICICGDILEGN